MTTTPITIENEEYAWKLIKEALDGKFDNDIVELNFDNWPKFHINVKGDRYNSSVTTSMMRSLIELQAHFNRSYAEIIYGKSAKSLTIDERNALEITFCVEEGSSDVSADLSGFFSELGKSAMEKMTGKQVVSVVLGTAALWASSSMFSDYLDSQQKNLEEQNRHEITLELVKSQPKLMQIQNEQIATYTNILKSVPDAEQVRLEKTVLNKGQLEMITKQDRQSTELKRLDDLYYISSLKVRHDNYKIEIIRASDDEVIRTELSKNYLSFSEMEKIMTAFAREKAINLNIVGRVRGDIVTSASIVGVNNQANGVEVTASSLETEKSS